jgi:hypothetical protein
MGQPCQSVDPSHPGGRSCIVDGFFIALLALLVDFGSFHQHHHGDSLVPILGSLYQWTPFYWGQDRLGWLVPGLAAPIRHPLANLLFQTWVTIALSLAAIMLLTRYVGGGRASRLTGLVTVGLWIGLANSPSLFEVMAGHQPYWPSLAFGVGALLVADRGANFRNSATATVLSFLGHWYNVSLMMTLVPLLAVKFVLDRVNDKRSAKAAGRGLLVIAGGFALSNILQFAVTSRSEYQGIQPIADWPHSWWMLLKNLFDGLWQGSLLLPVLAATAGVGLVLSARRDHRALLIAALLLVVAAVPCAAIGTLRWVALNNYEGRYGYMALPFVFVAATQLAIRPLTQCCTSRWLPALEWAVMAAIVAAVFCVRGSPSLSGVRRDLDRQGTLTTDLLDAGCTHVLGNYWDVWPAVFHVNLVKYERGGDSQIVHGIANRSGPTLHLWRARPLKEVRVAIPRSTIKKLSDEQYSADLALALEEHWPGVHLIEESRRDTIVICRPESQR